MWENAGLEQWVWIQCAGENCSVLQEGNIQWLEWNKGKSPLNTLTTGGDMYVKINIAFWKYSEEIHWEKYSVIMNRNAGRWEIQCCCAGKCRPVQWAFIRDVMSALPCLNCLMPILASFHQMCISGAYTSLFFTLLLFRHGVLLTFILKKSKFQFTWLQIQNTKLQRQGTSRNTK